MDGVAFYSLICCWTFNHLDVVNNATITSDLTWSRVWEGWKETPAGTKKEDSRFTYDEGVH